MSRGRIAERWMEARVRAWLCRDPGLEPHPTGVLTFVKPVPLAAPDEQWRGRAHGDLTLRLRGIFSPRELMELVAAIEDPFEPVEVRVTVSVRRERLRGGSDESQAVEPHE